MADNNTILEQTGQEVQEALNKIIDLGLATQQKDGLLSSEDKGKLDRLYIDPALVGRATALTPTENEDSTQIATTAFVQNIKRKMLSELVVVVDSLPTASEQTMGRIYLVPNDGNGDNTRDEYITVRSGSLSSYVYSWEKFGSVEFPPQQQADWNESDTENPSYIQNKPQIPSQLADLSEDPTHRVVTDAEKSVWDDKYAKPATGIPKADLATGVVPDISTDIDADKTSDSKTVSPRAVYSQISALQYLISTAEDLTFEPVATLPTASASTMNGKIYLVPVSGDSGYRNMYVTVEQNGNYSWSQVGTTQFSITGISNLPYLGAVLESSVTIND